MDVGAPSNFARILDLYNHSHATISSLIKGYRYSDAEIRNVVKTVYIETGYLCDPHGACGYQALDEHLKENQIGVFLETAHPAKFMETVEEIVGKGNVQLPEKLAEFMKGTKQSIRLDNAFLRFKDFLMAVS